MKIIFAQGNPDLKYRRTRHNTGFMVLDAYADAHGAFWKPSDKFGARIAETTQAGEKVLLVQPQSYYNETGRVARSLIDFYKLDPTSDFLVVHDDLALPFGTLRIRTKGGDAGNNGIKSLNQHLGDQYTRLRVGIWTDQRDQMDDISYVLGGFSADDERTLQDKIIPELIPIIDSFVAGTIETTSKKILEQ